MRNLPSLRPSNTGAPSNPRPRVQRTACARCGEPICAHADAEYQGVLPAPASRVEQPA